MDAVTGAKRFPQSFSPCKEPYIGTEVNRKRKLLQFETENTGLPWPKHKTLNHSATSTQEAFLPENIEKEKANEDLMNNVIGDNSEIESEQGSNSFTSGGSENKISLGVNKSTESFLQDQPSTYSGGPSCSMKEVNKGPHADLEDASQARFKSIEYQHESLDTIENEFIVENANNSMEDYHEAGGTDDKMLYSNDVAPFLRASDARLGTRKPTIDQEFEQYFSALML